MFPGYPGKIAVMFLRNGLDMHQNRSDEASLEVTGGYQVYLMECIYELILESQLPMNSSTHCSLLLITISS